MPLPAALEAIRSGLTYPLRHIAWRIIGPFVILTLVFAATGTYITTRIVSGSLRERFDNQLAESARVASDAVVRQERRHLEVGRAASFTDGMASALSAADSATVERLVLPIAVNAQVDRIEVLGPAGERLFGVQIDQPAGRYLPLKEEADRNGWSIVNRTLKQPPDAKGDKFSDIVATSAGYVLYTSAPVYDSDGLAGVVLVGTRVASLVPMVKQEALADVTIYADGNPVATTLPREGQPGENDLGLPPQLIANGLETGAVREERSLFGRGFAVLYTGLVLRDRTVGLLSVALPSDSIVNAGATTRTRMALLFTAATLAVLAIGWVIARTLTAPLNRLVTTARAVTEGDLNARTGIEQASEIGVLARDFDQMTAKLRRQHLATVRALTSAIDARDPYTLGHSLRVGQLALELGRSLGLPPARLQNLEIGGYLHDIGKIGIRDAVLLKAGRLSDEERALMEEHPQIGLRILEPVELAPEILEFVGLHHERLNGGGYPDGLRGAELSVVARIAAIADAYDALTTDRPYRLAVEPEQAIMVLEREALGGGLDLEVLATLRRVLGAWEDRRRLEPMLWSRASGQRMAVAV
jgi:putative nucleotidyltransferase with HDIG domain